MKVPANIIETKYTSGNEFVFSFNYKYYQGYYYELNDKIFAGKEFNINAPELVKAIQMQSTPKAAEPVDNLRIKVNADHSVTIITKTIRITVEVPT